MIRISDAAQAHFAKLLANQEEGTQIRVFVINPGTPNAECGVSYCPRMPWKPPTPPEI
ncbi:putative thioredoxin-like protein [Escherichia coli]|uniref:Putative thioredoxin-like protein n=1 Tax=Escherichia coli TaxID=562 RepID=A0A377C5Z4_ECOLX|nr:putative thioredoxin-like protein [Escherichia coli]